MCSDASDGLPSVMVTAWRLGQATRRGPKPALSVEGIVAAAVEIADREGLEAVSMARVAESLGFTTMSLYRHVAGKEDLLVLMVDAVVGEPPAVGSGHGWREALEGWARALRERYHAHLWSVRIPITGPPAVPYQLAWMEQGLAALAPTPLPGYEKLDVMLAVSNLVRSSARMTDEMGSPYRESGDVEAIPDFGQILAAVIDPGRFPELSALREEIDFAEEDPDEDYGFGFELRCILDGVERLIAEAEERPD